MNKVFIIIALLIIGVFAQEKKQKKGQSLDTITVYATKTASGVFEAPATVSVIDMQNDASKSSANDLQDIFRFIPGIDINGGPRKTSQSINLRGFNNDQIVILVDGRRQTFDSGHDGHLYIDPSLFKKVEVINGLSSAIYGGGAIGGVIAFETKTASDMLKKGQKIGSQLSVGYATVNEEFTGSISAYGINEKLDWLLNITSITGGDIELSDGETLPANDEINSALLNIGYSLSDISVLKFSFQLFNNSAKEPNRGDRPADTRSNFLADKTVKNNQLSVKYEIDNDEDFQLKSHIYFYNTGIEETQINGNRSGTIPKGRTQNRELDHIGFSLDLVSKIKSGNVKHTVSYGFEFYSVEHIGNETNAYRYRLNGQQNPNGQRGGVPNADAQYIGVYVQDEISIQNDNATLKFIPSLRFDSFESETSDDISNGGQDKAPTSQEDSNTSPKLTISYVTKNKTLLFASYGDSFRAPTLNELYSSGRHFGSGSRLNRFVANPNLKPETATGFELGIGKQFDNISQKNDSLSFKLTYYHLDFKDLIDSSVTRSTTELDNIHDAEIFGFEFLAQYKSKKTTLDFSANYTEAYNSQTEEYLGNNVPLTINLGINYKIDKNLLVGWRGKWVAEENKSDSVLTSSRDTHTIYEEYFINSFYARWQKNNLQIDLGIENAFDQEYTPKGYRAAAEAINFTAKLTYKF